MIFIPLLGMYIITKKLLNKENKININKLIFKISILSYIITLLLTIWICCSLHIFEVVDNRMIALPGIDRTATIINRVDTMEPYIIEMALINNVKFLIKVLILATLYIGFLVLIVLRYWINCIINVEKDDRKKQVIKLIPSIVLIVILLLIELLAYNIANVKEGNVQILFKVKVKVEADVTNEQRVNIEEEISKISEIVKYEYVTLADTIETLKLEGFNLDGYRYDSEVWRNIASYDITVRYKDKEKVIEQIKKIEGIEQ